jgi:hypothetical protein
LIGFIQSVFKNLDLFLKTAEIFCSGVDPEAVLLLLDNLLLKVGDVHVNILLSFLFLLDRVRNFVEELFHAFGGKPVFGLIVLLVVYFSLNKGAVTMSSLRA